jgi:iron complex transport system permease protein
MSSANPVRRAWITGLALAATLLALLVVSASLGPSNLDAASVARGLLALVGLGEPLDANRQAIVELRAWRGLCASGVGAALALSGAMIQGMFRNPLASPSLIGVTGGASVGAALGFLVIGGAAPAFAALEGWLGAFIVPTFAFVGAAATTAVVAVVAALHGRASVTSLLLVGIAVNLCVAGLFAAIQYLTLAEWEVSKAILAWTFGALDDRSGVHAATVWTGLALSVGAIPFIARELDLFRSGEEDALALGVDARRVKTLALLASSLAASSAVASAGQIGFVGLVVPHILRLVCSSSYSIVLWLSIPAGAVFLLGADVLQRVVLGDGVLQPGVMMSLVGGPFFLFLLLRQRREIANW